METEPRLFNPKTRIRRIANSLVWGVVFITIVALCVGTLSLIGDAMGMSAAEGYSTFCGETGWDDRPNTCAFWDNQMSLEGSAEAFLIVLIPLCTVVLVWARCSFLKFEHR
jgi:uncharacterized membrane protein YhaH (DUF805 family)